MYCKKCGSQITENSTFCPNCGAVVEAQQPSYVNNAPQAESYNSTPALVFGILSLVIGSIFGIIFGSIGKKKAEECFNTLGYYTSQAKVGRILSKIGFILGIVSTIIYAIYIIIFIALAATGSMYY